MLLNQKNLKERLVISFFSIILILFAIYFSKNSSFSFLFPTLTGLIICLSLKEYYDIAIQKGFNPLKKLGITFSAFYIFINYISLGNSQLEVISSIVMWLFLISSFAYYFSLGFQPFLNLAITIFGFIYLTVSLTLILNINYDTLIDGRYLLLYLLFISKITDTGAYFIGKKFGSIKLAPFISPKKSWEGAIGGFFCALMTSILFFFLFSFQNFSLTLPQSIWIGAIISILSQFGDLSESLLKRDAGVKDSSHLPGLGGFLDIVDSLIFSIPFVYFLLKFGVFT